MSIWEVMNGIPLDASESLVRQALADRPEISMDDIEPLARRVGLHSMSVGIALAGLVRKGLLRRTEEDRLRVVAPDDGPQEQLGFGVEQEGKDSKRRRRPMPPEEQYDTYAVDLDDRLRQLCPHLHAEVWRYADITQAGKRIGLDPDAAPPLVIAIRSAAHETKFVIEVERSAWPHAAEDMDDLAAWIGITADLGLKALEEGKLSELGFEDVGDGKAVAPIIHIQRPASGPEAATPP